MAMAMPAPTGAEGALALSLSGLRRREHAPRARVWVLFDPDGAFAATIARPRWLACLLVAALCALAPPVAFLIAASRGDDYASVIADEMKKSGRWDRIPPSARDRALGVIVPATKALLPVGAVAKRLSWIVTVALVCYGLVRATRPRVRLSAVLACAAVGAAPLFIHDLVAAAELVSAPDVRALDATNPVLSNPAAWWWSGAAGRTPLATALRALDVFELWACAWMVVGLDRAVGGRTRVPALVVVGLYVLLAAGSVVQAAFAAA